MYKYNSKDVLNMFRGGSLIYNAEQEVCTRLFSGNTPGFWYDPNDLSTMFQDASGTVPVSTGGQPVGLMLDKSKGLKRSSNFNTNGTWAAGAEWTINGEIATFSGTGSFTNLDKLFMANPITKIGDILKISINVLSITGSLQVILSGGDKAYITKSGVNNLFLKSGGNYGQVRFQGGNGVTATISLPSLVIEEVAGSHAYQTTSALRPILRQTPILGSELVVNGNLSNGLEGWVASNAAIITNVNNTLRVTSTDVANAQARQAGTSSAGKTVECSVNFKSKTGASSYVRLALYSVATGNVGVADSLISTTSGTLTFTTQVPSNFAGNLVLQLGGAASGDSVDFDDVTIKEITGYRTDQNYLAFDGIDDFLQTNNIDFTGTDKVTVIAAVRKLSDTSAASIVEASSVITNPGAFALQAPNANSSNTYSARVNGNPSLIGNAIQTGYNAPHSAVLTASINLAATDNKKVSLRVNRSGTAYNGETVNSGMLGNYPLYIGRRAGTSLPFNGYLYSLIGIGNLVSDEDTILLEKLMALKTGVTLNA